ncbi:MAG: hypothetical protein KDB26_10935 [Microthrixaceae bacterium]|nr:hypothetical protein [Microthrixaceae bacterium]
MTDNFSWTDAARWSPKSETVTECDPLDEDDESYGHLLTGRTADGRYLAWVQVTSWRGGADGWWTGDEELINAARRERGLLRDPDDIPLLAGVVIRVLGAGGRSDGWTRMVARIGERREVLLTKQEGS